MFEHFNSNDGCCRFTAAAGAGAQEVLLGEAKMLSLTFLSSSHRSWNGSSSEDHDGSLDELLELGMVVGMVMVT